MLRGRERGGKTYSDLKIHSFIRYRTHAVVEAERILAHVVRREDEVALALFLAVDYCLVAGADHAVVDVEGAAGLYLKGLASIVLDSVSERGGADRWGLRRTAK